MTAIKNTSTITSRYVLPDQTQRDYNASSNESVTENMTTSFIKQRSTAKDYGFVSDEVEQTLTLTNNSNSTIENIRIAEAITDNASFKAGSMTVDGTPYDTLQPSSYTLPKSIAPNATCEVKYKIVVGPKTESDVINMQSTITYDVVDVQDLTEQTNACTVDVVENLITIEKSADKKAVTSKQTLLFTNVITNKGNLPNNSVMFQDTLPDGVQFVADSVHVDGVQKTGANPADGISLEDMAPGKEITVTFQVTVD